MAQSSGNAAVEVRGRRPRYLRVVDQIVEEIRSGALAPGERLASERELSERFDVSRDTLRRAFTALAEEGYIRPSPRRGWFIATGPLREPVAGALGFAEWAATHGLPATSRVLAATARGATEEEARELEIEVEDPVFELERVRMVRSVPLSLDRSIVVLAHAPFLPEVDFSATSLYATLRDRAGIIPTRAEWEARATLATPRLVELLEVAPGDPMLSILEWVRDQDDRLFEYSSSTNRGDLYRYRTSVNLDRQSDR